jgi:hypothetical protein
MGTTTETYPIVNNSDKSGAIITGVREILDVNSKAEAKREVLEFLSETRIALPRKPLYRNLAYRGWSKSDATLQNYLAELRDEELIERVDAEEFADGNLKISNEDPGYWVITAEGVEYLEAEDPSAESDIDDSHL